MPDDDVPQNRAGTAAAASGDGSQPDQARAFEVPSLFPRGEHTDALDAVHHDDVGVLFADRPASRPRPSARPDPVESLHLTPARALVDTAAGHLFDEAETEAHPYTHSFPAPVPARPEPQHAAPAYGISRPQLIAMAVGIVITAAGAGWALATPTPSAPTSVQASPTATVDPERVAKVDQAIDLLGTAVAAAQVSADSFAAPLAAMAGSSDEAARVAADAARQAYVAAIAAVKVPEPAGKSASNASLDKLERDVAAANASLTAASAGFRGAITTFRQSIPAFAAGAVAENADAAEPFRTAATDAAAAVAASDPFGPAPFAAMDAWRGALAALLADQARAVEEGGSGESGRAAPEPTNSPAPVG